MPKKDWVDEVMNDLEMERAATEALLRDKAMKSSTGLVLNATGKGERIFKKPFPQDAEVEKGGFVPSPSRIPSSLTAERGPGGSEVIRGLPLGDVLPPNKMAEANMDIYDPQFALSNRAAYLRDKLDKAKDPGERASLGAELAAVQLQFEQVVPKPQPKGRPPMSLEEDLRATEGLRDMTSTYVPKLNKAIFGEIAPNLKLDAQAQELKKKIAQTYAPRIDELRKDFAEFNKIKDKLSPEQQELIQMSLNEDQDDLVDEAKKKGVTLVISRTDGPRLQ